MPLAALDRSRFPDRRHALPMGRTDAELASGSDSRHEARAAGARAGRGWAGRRRMRETPSLRLPARRCR